MLNDKKTVKGKKVQAVKKERFKTATAVQVSKPGAKKQGLRILGRYVLQDATGVELYFPNVADSGSVTTGNYAEIEGKPANGEFVMPDGRVFEFKEGMLTNIIFSIATAVYKINKKRQNKATPHPNKGSRFADIKTARIMANRLTNNKR